jgi:DNA-directed RNA polymerase subunit beta
VKGEPIRRPSIPESFNVLVKELQALGLKVELLKFKDEVAPEERVTIEQGEVETVEMTSRIEAEVEAQDLIQGVEKIAELEAIELEPEAEVQAGIEEGAEVEASGESAKAEMADSVSEESMEDA